MPRLRSSATSSRIVSHYVRMAVYHRAWGESYNPRRARYQGLSSGSSRLHGNAKFRPGDSQRADWPRSEIAAVVTQPDARAGRGQKAAISPVKALAEKHGLTVLQPPRIAPELLEQLRALHPSAIIVAAYGRILPAGLLSLPPRGCINVHASLLPRYRGAAPIPAAILAGDSQTGVTIMLLEEKLDTGPMLTQGTLDILPDDTAGSLTERLAYLGARLLLETLPDWLRAG